MRNRPGLRGSLDEADVSCTVSDVDYTERKPYPGFRSFGEKKDVPLDRPRSDEELAQALMLAWNEYAYAKFVHQLRWTQPKLIGFVKDTWNCRLLSSDLSLIKFLEK